MKKAKILFDEWHGTGGCEGLKQTLSKSYFVETTKDDFTYEHARCFDLTVMNGQLKRAFTAEDIEVLDRSVKEGGRYLLPWSPKTTEDCINFGKMTHDGGYGLVEDMLGKKLNYATDFVPYPYSGTIIVDRFLGEREINIENIKIPLSAILKRSKLKIYDPNYYSRGLVDDESKFHYKRKIELGQDMREWVMDECTDASVASTGMAWFERSDDEDAIYNKMSSEQQEEYKKNERESTILRRVFEPVDLDVGQILNTHDYGLSRKNVPDLEYVFAEHIEFWTGNICAFFKRKDYNGFSVGMCVDPFSSISEDPNSKNGYDMNKIFALRLIKCMTEGSDMSSRYPEVNKVRTENVAVENQNTAKPNKECYCPPF